MRIATKPVPALSETDKARFFRRINKDGPIPDQTNPHYLGLGKCWLWSGGKFRNGYGSFGFKGRTFGTHVLAFILDGREIGVGNYVRHRCDVKSCCNPDHLISGTATENARDSIERGQKPCGDLHWARRHIEMMPRGENHGRAILTNETVQEIKRRYAEGNIKQRELASEFGVCKTAIGYVIRGRTWKHIS